MGHDSEPSEKVSRAGVELPLLLLELTVFCCAGVGGRTATFDGGGWSAACVGEAERAFARTGDLIVPGDDASGTVLEELSGGTLGFAFLSLGEAFTLLKAALKFGTPFCDNCCCCCCCCEGKVLACDE